MLFFDEESIMNKVLEYSNNPKFKELLKKRIREVMKENKIERQRKIKPVDKDINKEELKLIIKEIVDDIKAERIVQKEQKSLGEKRVENIIEEELSGLFHQSAYLLGSEKMYIWTTGSLVLFIILFLFTKMYLFLHLALGSVLMMIITGMRIRWLHRKIFRKSYE